MQRLYRVSGMLMRFYGVVSAFIALLEVLNLSKVSID